MIVDDSAFIRKTLRNILEEAGYGIVCEAVNGEEAVQLYKEYKPDIVTMDITMPVMDGVTALEKIKAYDNTAFPDELIVNSDYRLYESFIGRKD